QESKVAWAEITYPKKEGGLGLRDLKLSNRVLVFRLLWDIFASHGSIWVAWLCHYRIKEKDLSSLSLLARDRGYGEGAQASGGFLFSLFH
ncbi:hypothetical protein LINPERHAP1_LOCUS292, partial [Linum perenne]